MGRVPGTGSESTQSNEHTLVAVVLAAGAGTRLRPITRSRIKPLCPVGNRPLIDWSLDRVTSVTPQVAVNAHTGRDELEAHLADRPVQLSLEEPEALGTAGALGQLRWWIDGRAVLTVNADTYTEADLVAFVSGWDGERVRLLLHRSDRLVSGAGVCAALMPWDVVSRLEAVPCGLYSTVWVPASSGGRLEVVRYDGPFFDCGTPRSYLAANLYLASQSTVGSLIEPTASVTGGVAGAVVGAQARIEGAVRNSVVWDRAVVGACEVLEWAIRTDDGMTVLVR